MVAWPAAAATTYTIQKIFDGTAYGVDLNDNGVVVWATSSGISKYSNGTTTEVYSGFARHPSINNNDSIVWEGTDKLLSYTDEQGNKYYVYYDTIYKDGENIAKITLDEYDADRERTDPDINDAGTVVYRDSINLDSSYYWRINNAGQTTHYTSDGGIYLDSTQIATFKPNWGGVLERGRRSPG